MIVVLLLKINKNNNAVTSSSVSFYGNPKATRQQTVDLRHVTIGYTARGKIEALATGDVS
jgi:hypothetical protein